MSASEVISEMKKLPPVQQRKVYQFADEQLRRKEDHRDNRAANRALEEPGGHVTLLIMAQRRNWHCRQLHGKRSA